MLKQKILLGYELKTGKPVELDLHHLIITGMTQLSGKTTTLEALLHRSRLTAVTFRTKRGELGFDKGVPTAAYFDEKGLSHWQALEGLLSATLEEKVQREPGVRAAIIKLTSGVRTLDAIYKDVKTKAATEKRPFMQDVYTKIVAYLDLVLPQLREYKFSNTVNLIVGELNVVNLEGMTDEVQSLVIFATIQWIYHNSRDTVIVMPEAWKFIPQDRGSPVKAPTEKFIREGAVIGNYLWIDSQDLRGVDKKLLRQIDNWILGRQRETHEIEATLKAIPLPPSQKPKAEELMQLKIGQFIACLHDDVKRVYVQPAWLSAETARETAIGKVQPEQVRQMGSTRARLPETQRQLVQAPQPEPVDTVIHQASPSLEIHRTRPILRLPVEALNEPTTALGRVVVVLKNDADANHRPDKWNPKRISQHLERHSWPTQGSEEAIHQLIRWEVLKVYPNGLMRFDTKRVQVVEEDQVVPVS